MKTRKIELSISIPRWWPYKNQWKALWKTILYKLWPDRCHVCKTRVNFKGSEFEGTAHNHRVMLSQYAKQPICGHCLAEKIKQYYAQAALKISKCDCCGEVKRVTAGIVDVNDYLNLGDEDHLNNNAVAKSLNLDVRYGMQWWNGFDLCQDCICEMLSQNGARSSYSMTWAKKTYHINHRGAMIHLKGKSL